MPRRSRFSAIAAQRPELLGDVYRGETAARAPLQPASEPAETLVAPDLTIAGTPVTIEAIDTDLFQVRTQARLCPGGHVFIRGRGADTTPMKVLAAWIVALGEVPVYAARLAPQDRRAPEALA